jgi:uncharacterized protein (UPF0332 family)
MKKINFLVGQRQVGKLEIVEPSGNVSKAYFEKSMSHMESAKILLSAQKIEESVSMSYYAMYHSLLSLLFKCGIKSENHAASIIILKELFNETSLADEISFAKKERIDKQYYVDFKLSKDDALDLLKRAESFSLKVGVLLNSIKNQDIVRLREELKEALMD